jgi:glutathione S-transferase
MMELYAAAAPNGRRAVLVMEELAFPYRLHLLDLAKRDQDLPAFRRLNPLGHVPVLIDPEGPGGAPLTLTQSGAIIFYLARKAGRLVPKGEAARAEVHQYTWMILSDVAAASTTIFLGSKFGASGKPVVDLFQERLRSYITVIDRRLATGPYLCGDLSVADFALLPLILLPHVAATLEQGGAGNVKRWQVDMMALPSVARALAKTAHH